MHQGIFSRYITGHAVALAILLEDARMNQQAGDNPDTVDEFMIRGPVCTLPWQPLSSVRQTLLENAFSFLPVRLAHGDTSR